MIGNSGIDQDVQAKMDAYRGNPNALAQKYSQSQQLIDLLALQKLKSEKEAAARDMQMKMGGQQMPTVADSREKEVLDLTKQELAQQTTGAMQQQQQQKQQAAKQLVEQTAQQPMMQGVAGLPAPNMAPKAMATGGIVAFSGEDQSYVDPLAAATGSGSEDIERDRERVERIRAQEEAEKEEVRQRFLRQAAPQLAAPLPEDRVEPTPRPEDRTAPPRAEPPRAAPQGQPGIAGLDPRALAIRDQYAQYVGLSPEERALREKNRADRAAFDADRFDPDRRRSEALTRWLLGAGGRTGIGSILGGAGAAAENYKGAMSAQERNAMVDRQKLDDEATKTDVGIRKFSMDSGIKTATDYAEIAARQAANALSRESMNQNKAFTILGTLEGRFNESMKLADANYNNKIKNMGIFPGQQPTPAQQQQLEIAQTERQRDILGAQQRLGPLIQQASIKAGIPAAGAAGNFRLQSVTPTP